MLDQLPPDTIKPIVMTLILGESCGEYGAPRGHATHTHRLHCAGNTANEFAKLVNTAFGMRYICKKISREISPAFIVDLLKHFAYSMSLSKCGHIHYNINAGIVNCDQMKCMGVMFATYGISHAAIMWFDERSVYACGDIDVVTDDHDRTLLRMSYKFQCWKRNKLKPINVLKRDDRGYIYKWMELVGFYNITKLHIVEFIQ